MRAKDIRKKISKNIKRKRRIRAKIFGTSELPRVSVFVSNRHIYAQAINDTEGRTLASCDGSKLGVKANKEGAKQLAANFAETLKNADIAKVALDRNGKKYHGVIAEFANSLRENGIQL